MLANFLREHHAARTCFQLVHDRHGRPHHLPAEVAYHYEHSSSFRVGGRTQDKLLAEIDDDEFFAEPIPGRLRLRELEDHLRGNAVSPDDPQALERLMAAMDCDCVRTKEAVRGLLSFARLVPRVPELPAGGRRPARREAGCGSTLRGRAPRSSATWRRSGRRRRSRTWPSTLSATSRARTGSLS